MDRGPSLARQQDDEASVSHVPGQSERLIESASQAQIIRAYQRDSSQVHRLIELCSELLRSMKGREGSRCTRWLAHRQSVINLVIRALFLILTFGRGRLTFGEEYTDIIPLHAHRRAFGSRVRRVVTILFLLLPSLLVSPSFSAYLRSEDEEEITPWIKLRRRLADILENPLAQALPDLHLVAFMFSGRFFEFGRRLTGMRYASTLPPRSSDQRPPTYEPLGLLMLLPTLYKILSQRRASSEGATRINSSSQADIDRPPLLLSPPATFAPLSADEAGTIRGFDTPNTYLIPEAVELPERQCILCLEPRGTGEGSGGTVAVTECGHIFCWGCLGGLEKPECPLCRQHLRMERLVAAYNL